MRTIEEMIIEYFRDIKKLPLAKNKSRKYTTFIDGDGYIYIGKKGAIRMGKNIKESISLTDRMRDKIVLIMMKYDQEMV